MAKVPTQSTSSITRKEYINNIGGERGVNLNFTLRIDNETELVPFLELLKRATKEVEADLKLLQATRKTKAGK